MVRRGSEHAELNERKWDSRAATYDEKRFDYFRYMQKRLIALIPLKENLHFLDLGCGTGWAVRHVARLTNRRGQFYGIDLSSKMIEKARDNSQGCENIHFDKANAEELAFECDFFDLVICTNSFHHYLHPPKVLNEIQRVLKSGGRIYIMDFTADGFIPAMVDRWAKRREPEHVKFYSTQEYWTLFAGAKLEHVATKLITFPMKVHIGEKRA